MKNLKTRINNYKQAIKDYEKNPEEIFYSNRSQLKIYGFCCYFQFYAKIHCMLNEMTELNQLMPKSWSNTDMGFWWKKTNKNVRIKALRKALKLAKEKHK